MIKVEITVKVGEKTRRKTVECSRGIVKYGLLARDKVELELENAVCTMYRDIVNPIIVEEGEDARRESAAELGGIYRKPGGVSEA